MRSYVIFNVLNRAYGIDIECVKRILPAQSLTAMPDEDSHVEGMFKYEDQIIKVLSFRKLIGERSYEEELLDLFPRFKEQHKEWMDALEESIANARAFSKTTDPHACALGTWIGSFHPDDKDVVEAMKKLDFYNQNLHRSAADLLEQCVKGQEDTIKSMLTTVRSHYTSTLEQLEQVSKISTKVAGSLQRCLVLMDNDKKLFGINIDAVEDIVHVDENELHSVNEAQTMGDFMNVASILEHNKKLITIVKDIRMNRRSK